MSLENISVKEICRVCLEKSKKLYPLLGRIPNVDQDILSMIKYCTSTEIIMDDDFPKGVCIPCFRTIRIAYNFIHQFNESNSRLLENKNDSICKHNCGMQEDIDLDDSENVEEIIIEYEKDFDDLSETTDVRRIEQHYEEIEIVKEDLVQEQEISVEYSDDSIKHEISIKDEESETSLDLQQDQLLEEIPELKLVVRKKDVQSFTCPICKKMFLRFEVGFVRHLQTHKYDTLKCDKCSLETTLTVDLYIQHYKKTHRFQCNICNKSYGRTSGLYYHMKAHGDKRIYKCTHKNCTRSFLTAWCLRKHLHTHSECVKYTCSECGSEFKTYGTFKYHQKTHNGNRSYLCTECGKTFLQLIHLKYHMWTHTGVKMFKCDKCPKSYTSQTQLKKHQKKQICGLTQY